MATPDVARGATAPEEADAALAQPADPPPYLQDGLQTEAQLGSMLEAQLSVVWPRELPSLRRHLERPTALKLLDVGCGHGAWARRVAERFATVEVTGVDLEHANVGRAISGARSSSAADRLGFKQANAFKLTQSVGLGSFDFAAVRSMLYTVPSPDRIVVEMLRAVKPDGGVAHFLCEDYGAVLAHPTRLDNTRFWAEGPCAAFRSQGCNPLMGRSIYAVAKAAASKLGLRATVTVTQLPISTAPTPGAEADEPAVRETMARIFETWSDYASFIGKETALTKAQAEEHFADLSAACRDPGASVTWLCTVCQVELQGRAA